MTLFPGTILNADAELVALIRKGVEKCNGNCPCVVRHKHSEATICPCAEYRSTGNCECKLYVWEEG